MAGDMLTFLVGAEKGMRELLQERDVLPLLQGAVRAGALCARLADADDLQLFSAGDCATGEELARLPLYLEGEPVGALVLSGVRERSAEVGTMGRLLALALDTVLKNNLKRALTTEVHTAVVQDSYQELVEKNRALALSEARYRELAENLETRVTERTTELRQAHAHILQQEKMAAVGQLAAGIAHEINNPLGFIISNLHALQRYMARLTTMLHFYRDHLQLDLPPESVALAAQQKWKELKLTAVCADLGDLLTESLTGAERVSRIVADLKGFSHVDDYGDMPVDLNVELERTVSVLSHQLSGKATIVRDLQQLPPLRCQPQLPGQIFLNILQNALATGASDLRITLSSAFDGERIRVSIADNGPGVPKEIRGRIFEPFFTTRPVGSGTGMGLAVVYDTVLKMGGTVSVGDAADGGADFIITVPAGKD